MNVLMTGASGFLGSHLFESASQSHNIALLTRKKVSISTKPNQHVVGKFSSDTNYSNATKNIECVVHVAARAHVINEQADDALYLYREVNTFATLSLASQAASDGVKRFIFISSIGVNGVSNSSAFKHSDKPNPIEDYAISKHEAEVGLKKIAEDTGMEVVIIRPPLVYGKSAPGNFGTLLKVAEKNLPLPLGAINNQRSFVAIDNLVDLIVTCIDHPNAANQTFLVSDDEEISTSNLLKKLTLAAGKKPWLIPVPVSLLKFAAKIFGKKSAVERFSSSLTVDIEHTKKTLNWKPPITLDEGIRRCFK